MKKKIINALPVVALITFFVIYFAPVFVMVLFSFNDSRDPLNFTGFSLESYIRLFTDPTIIDAMYVSIIVAVIATAVSLFIGTLAAIGLTKTTRKVRNRLLRINNFPIVNPEIITAVGIFLLFATIGIPHGMRAMTLAHIAFCIPYVVITVYPKLSSLDENITSAAMDLGAKSTTTITKVILPQIKGTLFAAGAIAFSMSFDDFIISRFTAGYETNISMHLFFNRRQGFDLTFNALGSLILLVIIVKVVVDIILKNIKKTEAKI